MDNNEIIFELVQTALGRKPRTHYKSKCQAAWDCPVCSERKNLPEGDGKANFEVNYADEVYRCWVCDQTEGTHGSLYKLFKTWGNSELLETYLQLRPNITKKLKQEYKPFIGLPDGFTSFKDGVKRDLQYKQAYNYIKSRGITDEIIEYYKIGYTIKGLFRNRIIIPSYNEDGQCDYFTARAFVKMKPTYRNPDSPKEEIIFNSSLIDWDKDIYLVEGGFDHIVVMNSIPMLGKKISDLLWGELYDFATKDIIIALDPDAIYNAIQLYKQLDGGRLKNRIKLLKYSYDSDLAELHQELSKEDFENLLKSAKKLEDYEL